MKPSSLARLAVLLVLCTGLGGCLLFQTDAILDDLARTTLDAQQLENELAASGSLENADPKSDPETIQALGQRVQEFVAKHPDKPRITVPIQVRMGWLYAVHGFDGLAEVTFENAKEKAAQAELSETQEIILNNYEHFVWWYVAAKQERWSRNDEDRAKESIDGLGNAAGNSDTPQIKARLLLVRVRQAARLVLVLDKDDSAVGMVGGALDDLLKFYDQDPDRRRALIATRGLLANSCDTQTISQMPQLQAFGQAMRPDDADKRRELLSLTRTTFEVFCQVELLQRGYADQIGLQVNRSNPPLLPLPDWMACTATVTRPAPDSVAVDKVACAPVP